MDYGNNTFLHPASWEEPEAVAAIIYFTDTHKTGGGTRVVPNTPTTNIYINHHTQQCPVFNIISFLMINIMLKLICKIMDYKFLNLEKNSTNMK